MKSQSSETELFGDFFYIYWPMEIDWCVHVGMLPSNSRQDIDYRITFPYWDAGLKHPQKIPLPCFFSTTFALSLECEQNKCRR